MSFNFRWLWDKAQENAAARKARNLRAMVARMARLSESLGDVRHWGDLRGRVSRVSILKDGQVSVVLRFGIDERDRAQTLNPGTVLMCTQVSAPAADAPC